MKVFFKIFFLILFLALLSPFFVPKVFAQTIRIEPKYPPDQGGLYERFIKESSYANYSPYIDGNIRIVDILFEQLAGEGDEYGICPSSSQKVCTDFKIAVPIKAEKGAIRASVCGAGKDGLKGRFFAGSSIIGKDCNEEKDYFHEGHIYRMGIYDSKKAEGLMALAEFYVKHSMPWVQVKPQKQKGAAAVDVTLWGIRPGGEGKNNYQIVVEGKDNNLIGEACVSIKDKSTKTYPAGYQKDPTNFLTSGSGLTTTMAPTIFGKTIAQAFPPGRYVVKINERINETNTFLRDDDCQGGFTYMHIPLRIVKSNSKTESVVGRPGPAADIEFDPNESDAAKEFDLFQGARAVCAEYDFENETCKKINTALGEFEVTAPGFIKTMFRFILTLAAFGSILIIIYSGYTLITSVGNKEKIAAARETITSAVVGLLFIIFSIVILEIIGVDILRIPGLTR